MKNKKNSLSKLASRMGVRDYLAPSITVIKMEQETCISTSQLGPFDSTHDGINEDDTSDIW